MSLFAIGDTHLSLSCEKPMDIFKGWDNYTNRLSENWSRVVGQDDTVVIAGDVSWAMTLKEAKKDFEFINALPGKKLLLKGNHDYWWGTLSKMNEFNKENGFHSISFIHNNAYLVGEFAVCGTRGWFYDDAEPDEKILQREAGRLKTSISAAKKTGGMPIVFLHYPPVNEFVVCKEILNVLKEEDIKYCYFGHLHGFVSSMNARFNYDGIQFELISADYLKFSPKLIK
ncbi:MAG TPA: metallophosphoesterase [Oscillospiraceae bacterium]|nr:metallophosphoesterase [Oscillospiraceae bacterium]